MQDHDRQGQKSIKEGTLYGIVLTGAVALCAALGYFESLENWLYDTRAKYCQFFTPPPTDRLVHLDIDDSATDAIGKWPWPRSKLAEMMDEIHLAGPKAMALDILFSEQTPIRLVKHGENQYEEVDDDRTFADSLHRLGCALVPLGLLPAAARDFTPIERELRLVLSQDLELAEDAAPELLRRRGIPERQLQDSLKRSFLNSFLEARRDVMHERIMAELRKRPLSHDQLRAVLFPNTDPSIHSPATRLFDEDYTKSVSELALLRFSGPLPTNIPPLLHSDTDLIPVSAFSEVAASTAFVDNPKGGAVLRQIPLFMEHGGRMYPQLGVELAAMMLDSNISEFRFTDNQIVIPRPGGNSIRIPVRTIWSGGFKCKVPTTFDIPWFGKPDEWNSMYDRVGNPHLSLNVVWDACLTRHRIAENNAQVDDALASLYEIYVGKEKADAFKQHPLPLDDPLNRIDLCKAALTEYSAFIEAAEKTNLADIKDPAERKDTEILAAAGRALRNVLDQNPKFHDQLLAQRALLQNRLHDKAILVGWTSTAQTVDQVATSIHSGCPGVVVHGTIFNAIMIGNAWRRVPQWVDLAIVLVMGLLTTYIATHALPHRAMIMSLLLAVVYTAINGYILFDWGKHIATLAGPLVVVAVAWAGSTLARLLIESLERARITRRFRSYVDPVLVQYVIDHPELVRLEGEMREMTVCFTDLAAFTSMAERLREKAVKILSRYIARMVPPIRRNRGFVHRFMGDGIMFSYGALIANPDMAADAVNTILEMKVELARLNDELESEGYPRLALRAGVNTGMAVVGDSGGDEAVEYACLGDTTNLAARLESANGALGTDALISARTVELMNGKFLVRPVARLVVKGRIQAVMTYEPLAPADSATPAQKQLAELTTAMFDHFVAGRFQECIASADRLEEAFGPAKLPAIYRSACQAELANPSDNWQGYVVLTEK